VVIERCAVPRPATDTPNAVFTFGAAVTLSPMPNGMSLRLRVTSLVVLALAGTWLGHGVEYGLVAGWRGIALGLWGPLHSYMLPAAVLLVLAAFVAALRLAAVARAARCRARLLWQHLKRGVRCGAAVAPRPEAPAEPHPLVLSLALGLAQTGLYLIQENVEAVVAGAPPPGLDAVGGAHWAAPLVQVAVAGWLTLGWLAVVRGVRRRTDAVQRVEEVLRAVCRRRRTMALRALSRVAPLSARLVRIRRVRGPPVLIFA
jgi:hypothetical protein